VKGSSAARRGLQEGSRRGHHDAVWYLGVQDAEALGSGPVWVQRASLHFVPAVLAAPLLSCPSLAPPALQPPRGCLGKVPRPWLAAPRPPGAPQGAARADGCYSGCLQLCWLVWGRLPALPRATLCLPRTTRSSGSGRPSACLGAAVPWLPSTSWASSTWPTLATAGMALLGSPWLSPGDRGAPR